MSALPGPEATVGVRTAPLDAVVHVPGSKSIANRALICAALADGESRLVGVPDGDDSAAMIACLGELGLDPHVDGDVVTVHGGRSRLAAGTVHLDARLAGTTSRFVTALAALADGPVVIDGGEPLRRRPMAPLHDALAVLGADVRSLGEPGHLPVEVRHGTFGSTGEVRLSGDVSSQFLTALMLVAPELPGGLVVNLSTPLVSRPYVAITAGVMAGFGVSGVEVGEHIVRVPAGRYAAGEHHIEPDASSASYPLAAAAICGGSVRVPGLLATSVQGDAGFADVLGRMGCSVHRDGMGTTVVGRSELRGVDLDMSDLSDLVPTLAVVAAFATTASRIRGVGFIRQKESDRIGDLVTELRRAGVDAEEHADGLTVRPSRPHAATLHTHHDHRLAMAFALLGLRVPGIVVADPGVVSKSWPGFWSSLERW